MISFLVAMTATAVFALLATSFAGIWVYKDAKQRGLPAGMWVLLVVLSGNFIGLILYLLVGRKQAHGVCDKCGSATNIQGAFCHVCGERINAPERIIKQNNGLLFACIACIVLVFASLGISIYSNFTAGGFASNRQYSYLSYGPGGFAKKVSQSSSGNTWEFSFEETSDGYKLSKTYNAESQPVSLSVDIHCAGSIQLIVTQNWVSINETLVEGVYHYDMKDFESGKIRMELVNIDAPSLTGEMVVEISS